MTDRTALIVIDMQLCGFDGVLTPPIAEGESVLRRVAALLAAAREAGVPVVFVQHEGWPGQPYARDGHGWEIHPDVAPEPGEPVVTKKQSSAFVETKLLDTLTGAGVERIVTCGIQSEHCLTNTSVSALELGLTVVVAEDAHGTVSTPELEAKDVVARQNALLRSRGATLQSVDALVASRFGSAGDRHAHP